MEDISNRQDNGAVEQTPIGDQYLIGDVRPVSQREGLEWIAALPMQPKRSRQRKPCDHGLFDEIARNQLDLF